MMHMFLKNIFKVTSLSILLSGIKVIGGCSEDSAHGIFIKRLLKDGKALLDGKNILELKYFCLTVRM